MWERGHETMAAQVFGPHLLVVIVAALSGLPQLPPPSLALTFVPVSE